MKNKTKIITAIILTLLSISLVACGAKEEEPVIIEMTAPMSSLMGEFEASLLAGMSADTKLMDEEFLSENYGITPDMYVDIAARLPQQEHWCDEYFFIQASEGNIDKIVDAAKERVNTLLKSEEELSEEHREMIENYQLYVRGDYAVFIFGLSAENAVVFFKDKFIE